MPSVRSSARALAILGLTVTSALLGACRNDAPADSSVEVSTTERLGFGAVHLGELVQRSVFVSNDGTTPLRIESARIEGDLHHGFFQEVGDRALPPREDVEVRATFAPSQEGPQTADLVITVEVPGTDVRRELRVALDGIGLPADMLVDAGPPVHLLDCAMLKVTDSVLPPVPGGGRVFDLVSAPDGVAVFAQGYESDADGGTLGIDQKREYGARLTPDAGLWPDGWRAVTSTFGQAGSDRSTPTAAYGNGEFAVATVQQAKGSGGSPGFVLISVLGQDLKSTGAHLSMITFDEVVAQPVMAWNPVAKKWTAWWSENPGPSTFVGVFNPDGSASAAPLPGKSALTLAQAGAGAPVVTTANHFAYAYQDADGGMFVDEVNGAIIPVGTGPIALDVPVRAVPLRAALAAGSDRYGVSFQREQPKTRGMSTHVFRTYATGAAHELLSEEVMGDVTAEGARMSAAWTGAQYVDAWVIESASGRSLELSVIDAKGNVSCTRALQPAPDDVVWTDVAFDPTGVYVLGVHDRGADAGTSRYESIVTKVE